MTVRLLKTSVLMLMLASLIIGCGRKGPLEPPPGEVIETTDDQGRPIKKEKRKVPDRPFILDALI